eukprot:6767088-Karenia_brevis.AAC.1
MQARLGARVAMKIPGAPGMQVMIMRDYTPMKSRHSGMRGKMMPIKDGLDNLVGGTLMQRAEMVMVNKDCTSPESEEDLYHGIDSDAMIEGATA